MRRAEDKVMTSMVYGKDTDKSMTGIKVGDYEAKSERRQVGRQEGEGGVEGAAAQFKPRLILCMLFQFILSQTGDGYLPLTALPPK